MQTVIDLLFTDDCALLANILEDMKLIINNFSGASKAFGQTVDIK